MRNVVVDSDRSCVRLLEYHLIKGVGKEENEGEEEEKKMKKINKKKKRKEEKEKKEKK